VRPCTVLLLLGLVAVGWSSGTGSDPGPAPAIAPHAPILILGDTGFTAANGVVGGSGTFTDPYIIAGWDIDATLSNGIDIQDTTAHFILRDVYVHSTPSTLDYPAIRLSGVENGRVENVTLEDTLDGIWGQAVTNLTIARSAISRTGHSGVYLGGATNLTIRDNVIQDSGVLNTIPAFFQWDGIALNVARLVTIAGNRLIGNDQFGVDAYDVWGVTVTDNRFEGNWGGSAIWMGFDLDVARNIANNQSGYGFDFIGAHNVTVEDNQATNTLIGVLFSGILGDPLLQNENVTVRRNQLSGNWEGMLLNSMVSPQVSDNVMRGNLNPALIVELTDGGLFTGNVVEGTQWDGVHLYQANRTTWLRNNLAGAVNFGLHALDSHDGTLVENRIAGNGVGVALEGSTGWLVHHNLFESNALQAQDDLGAVNTWDDGYPSGGNWWSDYGGVDQCSGPLQNICPNPDSIGDTPYVIDPDSRDRYPLWTPAAIPPSASFTVTPAMGNITTVFTFDANASWDANEPAAGLLALWDWEDDGTWDTAPTTNKTATHAYAAPGLYTVRLQVRDSTNLTNETTRQVLVEDTAPVAAFTVNPGSGNVTTSFTADASNSTDLEDPPAVLEVRWDWEDDGTWDTAWSRAKVANHLYAAPGNYTIRLQVRDSAGLTAEATRDVRLLNTAPVAAFDLLPAAGNVSTVFTADASNSTDLEDPTGVLEVRWDWEDDGVWDTAWSTTKTATHTFPAVGAYTTRLQVRDAGGLTSEATRTVSLANTGPTADLQASPAVGGLATSFAFDASLSSDLEDPAGLEARWDWEDDAVWDTGWSAGLTAAHAYGVPGVFVVRLEVRDTGGLTDTATAAVQVFPDPVTALQVGSPNVTLVDTYVTAATPLALAVTDPGGGVLRSEYRIDGGTWIDFAVSGPFTLSGDGVHAVEWRSEDVVGNLEAIQSTTLVVDDSAPSLVLSVQPPAYFVPEAWVTSVSPVLLTAQDSGNPAVGLDTVEYRDWLGTWFPWVPYSGPFTLSGEGRHFVEYRATDLLGNPASGNRSLVVDDSPPTTLLTVGVPKIEAGSTFVTSATPLTLSSTDGGPIPVGVAGIEYRIDAGTWQPYAAPFTLAGGGTHVVAFRGTDLLGNVESERTRTLIVDDTPPTTALSPVAGPFNESTEFTLTASDAGSGVAGTEVGLDGSPWGTYAGAFRLPPGNHTLRFRSLDALGNLETEVVVAVTVAATEVPTTPPPTPSPGPNYKPVVAAVFAAVLLLAGYWLLVHRRRESGSREKRKVFLIHAAPWAALEATTGVVSAATGLLAIPPLLGPGTVVDGAILLAGLAWIWHRSRSDSGRYR